MVRRIVSVAAVGDAGQRRVPAAVVAELVSEHGSQLGLVEPVQEGYAEVQPAGAGPEPEPASRVRDRGVRVGHQPDLVRAVDLRDVRQLSRHRPQPGLRLLGQERRRAAPRPATGRRRRTARRRPRGRPARTGERWAARRTRAAAPGPGRPEARRPARSRARRNRPGGRPRGRLGRRASSLTIHRLGSFEGRTPGGPRLRRMKKSPSSHPSLLSRRGCRGICRVVP